MHGLSIVPQDKRELCRDKCRVVVSALWIELQLVLRLKMGSYCNNDVSVLDNH